VWAGGSDRSASVVVGDVHLPSTSMVGSRGPLTKAGVKRRSHLADNGWGLVGRYLDRLTPAQSV
jgi:hypothetical protein